MEIYECFLIFQFIRLHGLLSSEFVVNNALCLEKNLTTYTHIHIHKGFICFIIKII